MPIDITVSFDDNEQNYDASLILFGELEYRFGGEHTVSRHFIAPDDELSDEEMAADIAVMLAPVEDQVRQLLDSDDPPAAIIDQLHQLQLRYTTNNTAMRYIDTVVQMVRQHDDQAPPHGIERPELTNPLPDIDDRPPRPNPTVKRNNTPRREEAITMIRDMVGCPHCHVPPGQWCQGDPAKGSYGHNHMHERRISLVYGETRR